VAADPRRNPEARVRGIDAFDATLDRISSDWREHLSRTP
jgi:hypothetical protein